MIMPQTMLNVADNSGAASRAAVKETTLKPSSTGRLTVSGSARSTGALPLRERAAGTQRPRAHPRVSQSVGRDGSSWAIPSVRRLRKNARRRLCNPQGERSRRGTGCFGSRVTGACSLPAPVSRKRRVTVGPSCQQARRHAGSCRPVTASSLQVTVARFARGTPRALAAFGLEALIARTVRRLSGCRASRALQAPRVPEEQSTGLAPLIRQLVATVLYAHEPPRSTRCSGNASTTGTSRPGIWTPAAYCILPPQGERTEISNASPSSGRTRQVARRASCGPPPLAVEPRS